MTMGKLAKSFALCACALLGSGEATAGFIVTQESVEPGVWTSDFDAAKAYAETNNIPMFLFWANAGCIHCEAVEKEMNKTPFLAWMSRRNMIMVFVESDFTVQDWIQEHADTPIYYYPFAAVYWPSNTKGEQVLKGFSAYAGNMGQYGANAGDSNIDQIMDAVDFLLPDWSPGGAQDKRDVIDPAEFFKKPRTISAVAYKGGGMFGMASITLGRYNARKRNLKVSFKIKTLAGKTYSKSLSVAPGRCGDILDLDVAFKSPIGIMNFNLVNYNGWYDVSGEAGEYSVADGNVVAGGRLESVKMLFSAELECIEPESDKYVFIVAAPSRTCAMVRNGSRLDFGAAPKLKYNRRDADGKRWYGLAEYDEVRYPNVNAVKIAYKPATGAFTGSFSIYASNEFSVDGGKKPTIKTYKAKVSGYVVNGAGVGSVSVKIGKKTCVGTCTLDGF